MKLDNIDTIEAIEKFLEGNQPVAFSVLGNKQERYAFIQQNLVKFRYLTASKREKGLVIRFLIKITGYSKAQMTRLIQLYRTGGRIIWRPSVTNGFSKKYRDSDVRLLVKMDELHDTPCGQMVKTLCERAVEVFNDHRYQNVAKISVSHLYNLRASKTYKNQRTHFEKTKPTAVAIGERRKPYPEGKPGYIRIDSVHQGDRDKQKGVYHIIDGVRSFLATNSSQSQTDGTILPSEIVVHLSLIILFTYPRPENPIFSWASLYFSIFNHLQTLQH